MHGEVDMIDQEARDRADEAASHIESHEKLCTERWNQSRAAQDRVEGALKSLQDAMNDRIGKLPASVIAILMGICGFLAARAFPTH
jgi:hypothetical protein